MPYKRFKKTVHKKVRGKWTKQKTYASANKARKSMLYLRAKEEKSKKVRK